MHKKLLCIFLALLLVLSLLPAFAAIAEEGQEQSKTDNFALASKGATYTIAHIKADGTEEAPGYTTQYPDNEFKLLNDGVSNVGETAGATVAMVGTGYVYRVKFELGETRSFNRVVVKNLINSSAYTYNGTVAGNRGYSKDAFKVYVDEAEKPVKVSEKNNNEKYSMEVTLDFEEATGKTVWVEMKTPVYVLSLDEIEIFKYEAPAVTTTESQTETSKTETGSSSSETGTSASSDDTAPTKTSEESKTTSSDTVPTTSETEDPSVKIINHALAENGASYTISRLNADGTLEESPAFANSTLTDYEFKKLNDGKTYVGETEASVGLAGTNRTHRIKFDLGSAKHIEQIALKNMINSYSFSFGGSPAGNRSFDTRAITVTADGKSIPFNLYKKSLGEKYAFDIIIDINGIEAQKIVIELKPDNVYVVSLDEVQIFNGKYYKKTEIDLIDDGSNNYAFAGKGATYEMVKIVENKEEEEEYASGYKDLEFLLLNDGYTNCGETAGASAAVTGSGRIHRIKFDLGITREINKVVLRNMINSANTFIEGEAAGNRGYDSDAFKLTVDGQEINFTKEERGVIGCGYAYDIIMTFDDIEAQYVVIEMKSSDNAFVISLDEVEIFGGHDEPSTTTETSATETTATETTATETTDTKPGETSETETTATETTETEATSTATTESETTATETTTETETTVTETTTATETTVTETTTETETTTTETETTTTVTETTTETETTTTATETTKTVTETTTETETTTTTAAPTETTNPPFQRTYGDVDFDGEANSLDATLLLKYDAGIIDLSDEALLNGDVDGNGEADSNDATIIFQYDAGIIDYFPVEKH